MLDLGCNITDLTKPSPLSLGSKTDNFSQTLFNALCANDLSKNQAIFTA
jgi:hypothetical protein